MYDWGRCFMEPLVSGPSFDGRFFTLEWFGLHVTIYIGCLPKGANRDGR